MGTLILEPAPATHASAAACERERTWRLLIACARHAAGLTGATEVASVATTVDDWAHVERRASAHGLLPWLARALSQGDGAPSDERASSVATSADHAALMAAANACAGRTLAQVRRLSELIGALANVGVTALPFKGPVLSLQLYGDLALRHLGRFLDQEHRNALVDPVLEPRGGAQIERATGGLGEEDQRLVGLGTAPVDGHALS